MEPTITAAELRAAKKLHASMIKTLERLEALRGQLRRFSPQPGEDCFRPSKGWMLLSAVDDAVADLSRAVSWLEPYTR